MAPTTQPSVSTTALLTEHLEYPPIALLDDIINAVNNVLYKCTAAIEAFLRSTPPCANIPDDEIELGTAKLETLLENAIDRNFDRFELYVLRNVLAVPDDVVDGWMRLAHHKGIDFSTRHDQLELRLLNLRKVLQASYHVNEKLRLQIRRNKEILNTLRVYNSALSFLQNTSGVAPLDETVRFLVSQQDEIQSRTRKLRQLEASSSIGANSIGGIITSEAETIPERDLYIEKMTAMIVGTTRGTEPELPTL
ncbi:Mis12 protein-domain-containing protein [Limtongia smithiae]|uniref:Mis12 protein-domain-containing protein n=1 Tax=Limtongia smithiae TaxID=1125753 RepID=UPI0034CEB1DB